MPGPGTYQGEVSVMWLRGWNGLLALVLALFAIVQYNDPDFLFWFVVYGAGAVWCAAAAARPVWLRRPPVRTLLGASLGAAVFGVVYFWPTDNAFWQKSVWWESEGAREGMGMMVLAVFLMFPLFAAWLGRERVTS